MPRHITDILFGASLFAVGAVGIFRPVIILRWAKQAHPQIPEDDGTALAIVRLIGLGILAFAGFFLMIIVRSFGS